MSYFKKQSNSRIISEEYTDISSTSTFKSSPMKDDKYFILHHTAGRGKASDVMNVLNNRRLGIQWIIDRDGKLFKTLPSGHRGAHIKLIRRSVPKDLSNRTSQGVEIIAKDDTDISITQCRTALKLIKSLGYPLSNVYGHGDVSTNRGPDEGKTCKAYIKKYWNTPESQLPGSDVGIGDLSKKEKGGSKKSEKSDMKLFGYDLGKVASDLKDKFTSLFSEEEYQSKLDFIIEREIKNYRKKILKESETYGFPEGEVDSKNVFLGGENNNWDGSMERALEFAKMAKECTGKSDVIMSQKRSREKTASGGVSDHYAGNLSAYAVDLYASGEEGDKLLACMMEKWNDGSNSDYKGGHWLNVKKDGYRYQFGWRVSGHFDHIHVGVKKIGGKVEDFKKDENKDESTDKDKEDLFSFLKGKGLDTEKIEDKVDIGDDKDDLMSFLKKMSSSFEDLIKSGFKI